jgi:hypothetical protein
VRAAAKINRPRAETKCAHSRALSALDKFIKRGDLKRAARWAALSALLRKLLKPTLKIILYVLSYLCLRMRASDAYETRPGATKMYFSANRVTQNLERNLQKESTKVGDRLVPT